MLCPHCGKEIGETITMNAALPNLNNGCNPTFVGNVVPFAANGCNPVLFAPNGNLFSAAAAGAQQITFKLP